MNFHLREDLNHIYHTLFLCVFSVALKYVIYFAVWRLLFIQQSSRL
jgi:hypothetical protein